MNARASEVVRETHKVLIRVTPLYDLVEHRRITAIFRYDVSPHVKRSIAQSSVKGKLFLEVQSGIYQHLTKILQ
jgi:hypothetical protein